MNRLYACLAAALVCGSAAFAQPTTKPADADKPQKTTAPSADAVKVLLQQLESGKYEERNQATKKLMSAGKGVIEPVTKAAHTDDLELGARCVDILKHLYQNGDAATKAAAEASLKKLQSSKHTSVAKWAGEALGQGNNPFGNNPFGGGRRRFGGRGRAGGRIIIGGGAFPGGIARPAIEREAKATVNGKSYHFKETLAPNRGIVVKVTEKVKGKEKTTEYKAASRAELRRKNKAIYDLFVKHIRGARLKVAGMNNLPRIQFPGGAGGVRNTRITTRITNGQRQVDVQAGGRKISISDNQGKDIVVKITESVNGKETTNEYKAKDLAELKKKHPVAAKVYEQYTGGIRAFGGGAGFFPRQQTQRPDLPQRPRQ